MCLHSLPHPPPHLQFDQCTLGNEGLAGCRICWRTARLHQEEMMKIFCCSCLIDVEARLTTGRETYPHRKDLHSLPFWKCDRCKNFVGCHHKTKDRTRPLGVIASPSMKKARMRIHAIIDPLWQSGAMARHEIYKILSARLGRQYHTAELRTPAEVSLILGAALSIRNDASGMMQ